MLESNLFTTNTKIIGSFQRDFVEEGYNSTVSMPLHYLFLQTEQSTGMRQVPLERDIKIAVNGCSGFATSTQKGPFAAMLISRSRGTYLIK